MIEVEECSLLSHLYDVPEKSLNTSVRNADDARRILFKDFGSKQAIRSLDRTEKMKMNVDVVKQQLDKTIHGNFNFILKSSYLIILFYRYYGSKR